MSQPAMKPSPQTGAELLVKSLEAQGVEYVVGIPRAKIDKVFDTLLDSGWYLATLPTITANWKANSCDVWIVPVGGGVGKHWKAGELGVGEFVNKKLIRVA